jgi:uncharacterized membrane protein
MQQIATKHFAATALRGVGLERVAFDAPWLWLAAGWHDLWRLPRIGLCYGTAFAAVSVALAIGLLVTGLASLTMALAGGFLLISPLAAVGLYATSQRLEAGQQVTISELLKNTTLPTAGQLGFFGAILAFAYIVWLLLAFLLFMLFLGSRPLPPPSAFVPTLLFTSRGLDLLVTGTAVGAVLAALVFTISVISVPLLMTRRIDVVSAMAASVACVLLNPKPMALWAGLIAGIMVLGVASLFVGLVIAFPLIGHATWHAFRQLVQDEPVC